MVHEPHGCFGENYHSLELLCFLSVFGTCITPLSMPVIFHALFRLFGSFLSQSLDLLAHILILCYFIPSLPDIIRATVDYLRIPLCLRHSCITLPHWMYSAALTTVIIETSVIQASHGSLRYRRSKRFSSSELSFHLTRVSALFCFAICPGLH